MHMNDKNRDPTGATDQHDTPYDDEGEPNLSHVSCPLHHFFQTAFFM